MEKLNEKKHYINFTNKYLKNYFKSDNLLLLSQLLLLHIKTHTAISLQFVRMVFIFVSFFFTTLDQLASLYGMYIVQHQTRTQNCMDGSVRFLSLDKNWQNRNWISGFFFQCFARKNAHTTPKHIQQTLANMRHHRNVWTFTHFALEFK